MARKNNCEDCFYYKQIGGSNHDRCCNYIFIEDKMRPCEPGDDCTVKIPMKVNRRKGKDNGT